MSDHLDAKRGLYIGWLLAATTCGFASRTAAQSNAPPPASATRSALIESLDMSVPVAPTPVRIAGRLHLAYELHLTNPRADSVVVTRIRVVSAEDSISSLADVTGDELARRVQPFGRAPAGGATTTLAPGVRRVFFAWIALPAGASPPRAVRHLMDVTVGSVVGGGTVQRMTSEPFALTRASPAVLYPPLRGGDWVAIYDPFLFGGHRTSTYVLDGRARIPGRFAIDFVRLPPSGTFDARARGVARNGFGAEVLAVADGIIAAAADDMPDNNDAPEAPRRRFPIEQASGTFVALSLGGGRVAFYEHLEAGSVRVRVGARVRAGDVIARLGYSGSSSIGPHLHFHVSDGNSLLGAEGVPFIFRSYRERGAFAGIDAFVTGARWLPSEGGRGGAGVTRRDELPSPNSVIDFGGGAVRAGPPGR